MTPTKLQRLKELKESLKNTPIKFKIEKVEVIKHREKTGDYYWLVLFRVEKKVMLKIREKLQLSERSWYNPHIVVLELKID